MSISGAVLILIVILIRAAAIYKLPKSTFLALWYAALLRLLLPVAFRFPFNPFSMLHRNIPGLDAFENGIADFGTFAAQVLSSPVENMENGTVQTIETAQSIAPSIPVLIIIWAMGAAAMAGFFIVQGFRCRREFQTALPLENEWISDWRKEHPLRRIMDIRQLTGLSTPLTYGILHPVILLPKNMDWSNEQQIQYILFHEYVHIRRFDAAGKQIASIALCIHWFNPLVWVLYYLMHRDMELSCDEYVLRHFGRNHRKEYAMTLIRMEEQRNALIPFGNSFSRNAAEERIKAIMQFRKKSLSAAALAVLIVAAGTVIVFAAAPKADSPDISDVLLGEAPFFYAAEGTLASVSIEDVPALFDPYDSYMKIWTFALQDLDGDGNAEVILTLFGVAGDTGGHLILHRMDGRVYGYTTDSRTLVNLKTDGTYSYSDPTGAAEGGICSITDFTENGYTIDKITFGQGTYNGWESFVVNRHPATEEEFLSAETIQSEKPDTAWYDFSAENIKSAFQ